MGSWFQRGVQWATQLGSKASTVTPSPSAEPAARPIEFSPAEAEAAPRARALTAVVNAPQPVVPQPVSSNPSVPVASQPQAVVLAPGQPISTTTPELLVAALPPGVYTFSLHVTDDLGATSAPVNVNVQVNAAVPK